MSWKDRGQQPETKKDKSYKAAKARQQSHGGREYELTEQQFKAAIRSGAKFRNVRKMGNNYRVVDL